MAQNIYDDDRFLAGYSEFPRSSEGLEGMAEWRSLRAMLPDLAGCDVVELGCGFGHFARWAAEQGAKSVAGYDLSEKMLARAQNETDSNVVTYQRADLDTLELSAAGCDVVFSSMTLHYLEDFPRVCRMIHAALRPGGRLVFSVEHPVFAARLGEGWIDAPGGGKAWAVSGYSLEGKRVTNWIADGVVKYHRTIATMLRCLRDAGFELSDLEEWKPDEARLAADPSEAAELERPTFLLMALQKKEQ